MTDARTQSELTTSELVEGILFYPIALVISATVAPGLTLCIPGLILAAAFVIIPLAAMALVVILAAAVVAAPVVLVRAVRRLGRRRLASKRRVAVHGAVPNRSAPVVYFGRPTLASAATAHMAPAQVRTGTSS